MLIDIDPVRPSDVNATDAEKQAAAALADRVAEYLAAQGWPVPLRVDSGNGFHLIYPVDLPPDDGGLTRRLLAALSGRFDTPTVKVDRKVFNPSRVAKLAGTLSSKGTPTDDRPARVAELIDVPDRVIVPRKLIEAVAGPEPVREPQPALRPGVSGSAVERARAYMATVDPAVSGKQANPSAGNERRWHDQTFHAACVLTLGFDLSPADALPLLEEWNQRCDPPWTTEELRHKLADARKKGGPRGYLLTAGDAPAAAWDCPQVIAVRARGQLPDGSQMNVWVGCDGPFVLGVRNGLLDPAAGTLRPFDRRWFSTVCLPVAFDPAARCPQWGRFVDTVMCGDPARAAVLQEVFGACLDPTLNAKFFALFVGGGDNGKSVTLNVLGHLLGAENVSAVKLDSLSANRFAAWGMFGKLANIVGDQGFFESKDEGRLKELTGGDTVEFERKGHDAITAKSTARLLFACNEPPTFKDRTDATWNRAILLPFDHRVPAGEKNPAMLSAGHWAAELPGVLNWALAGLARLRAGGFTRAAACEALKERHRRDSDIVRDFLLTEYEAGAAADVVPTADLHAHFLRWAGENGLRYADAVTRTKLSRRAADLYPQPAAENVARVNGKAVRVRCGMKLRLLRSVTVSSGEV